MPRHRARVITLKDHKSLREKARIIVADNTIGTFTTEPAPIGTFGTDTDIAAFETALRYEGGPGLATRAGLKVGDRVRLVNNADRAFGPRQNDEGLVHSIDNQGYVEVTFESYRSGWYIESAQFISKVDVTPEPAVVFQPAQTEPRFTETIKLPETTAVELLKTYSGNIELLDIPSMLRRLQLDKDYALGAIRRLGRNGIFGWAIEELLLRTRQDQRQGLFNYFGSSLSQITPAKIESYTSTTAQTTRLYRARQNSGNVNSGGASAPIYHGDGMGTVFNTTRIPVDDPALTVPIAIIGAGAAGIIVAQALRALSFNAVQIFEVKHDRRLGIWARSNVYNRTRNNPRKLQLYGSTLNAAPGSGQEVRTFLSGFAPAVNEVNIERIEPGTLRHKVIGKQKNGNRYEGTFPIVVNCMGLGKPTVVSDPDRMTTTAKASECGPRWQQELKAQEVRGQRLILIGLGNSTAEMLRQLHPFLDAGVDLDYRILTHYSEDAVWNPDTEVNGTRVFRDVSKPNLVDFQGDLPESRFDYHRALLSGKILCDVRQWDVKDGTMRVATRRKRAVQEFEYSRVYTLTGYRHTDDSLAPMGIRSKNGVPLVSYDGEFLAADGITPIKGYFGFGSVIETPINRNAVVIPGMLGALGDTVFSLLLRAAEAGV